VVDNRRRMKGGWGEGVGRRGREGGGGGGGGVRRGKRMKLNRVGQW